MNIHEEYAFRIAFAKQHDASLTDGAAGTRVMQEDPDFYGRWRHFQRYQTDPGRTIDTTRPAPTYEAILAEVDAMVHKTVGTTRPEAFAALRKAHHGQPDEAVYAAAYSRYVIKDQAADVVQALIAKTPFTPLTPEEI